MAAGVPTTSLYLPGGICPPHFPTITAPHFGHFISRQGTPRVFGTSSPHEGQIHASGGTPRRPNPRPGGPL